MAAVPIYVWNGSAWQETGPTIPANPIKYQASAPSSPSTGDIWVDSDGDVTTGSQQFQRFRFVASGGETTISGADANGAVLAYTAGLEQVVLNGAVLVRGHDYTATDGTTITGLSPALVASDVLEVFSFIAFTVANTYTQSQVDGLIDAAPGMKLVVPTSAVNGTVGATGVVTFSGASSVSLNGVFSSTYDNYRILLDITSQSANANLNARLRVSGSDNTVADYSYAGIKIPNAGTLTLDSVAGTTLWKLSENYDAYDGFTGLSMDLLAPKSTINTKFNSQTFGGTTTGAFTTFIMSGVFNSSTSFDSITFYPASGTITGTVRVYGYKN